MRKKEGACLGGRIEVVPQLDTSADLSHQDDATGARAAPKG